MSVREIVTIGDPVLRERAREVTPAELRSAAVQGLIDDLIETRRAADGAGLAANQIGVPLRVAVAQVEGTNPRYPYKPPIPLTVMVNPAIEPLGAASFRNNEGCLSVPDLRGDLDRFLRVRVRYLDRDGDAHEEEKVGLTAGTFQHEVDHLDGILFCDRADPRTLSTWENFDRHRRAEFVARVTELTERVGS
ncbi:MAG TPA: peptide deformylase [Solirubrobacterales bacterium]|nr:peptide deformylase [Solirubrobacterales bacterium]